MILLAGEKRREQFTFSSEVKTSYPSLLCNVNQQLDHRLTSGFLNEFFLSLGLFPFHRKRFMFRPGPGILLNHFFQDFDPFH